jgi:hypothetical protein
MRIRTRLVVLIAAGALSLTACGSTLPGMPEGAAPAVGTSTAAAAVTTGAGAAAPATETGSGNSGDSSDSGSGDSGSGGLPTVPTDLSDGPGMPSAICITVGTAFAGISMSFLNVVGSGTGTYDSSAVVASIDSAVAAAPDELKPQFQLLGDAAKQAQGKSLEEATKILGDPKVSQAMDSISTWITKNCG